MTELFLDVSNAFIEDRVLLGFLAVLLQLLILLRKFLLDLLNLLFLHVLLMLSDPIVVNVALVILELRIFLILWIYFEKDMTQLHSVILQSSLLETDIKLKSGRSESHRPCNAFSPWIVHESLVRYADGYTKWQLVGWHYCKH